MNKTHAILSFFLLLVFSHPVFAEEGASRQLRKGIENYKAKQYLSAKVILEKVVYDEPENQEALDYLSRQAREPLTAIPTPFCISLFP